MSRDFQEEYKMLLSSREKINSSIMKDKKRDAWEYFRKLGVNVSNLEKNLLKHIDIYKAPLQQIHGSKMCNWTISQNLIEIYIDNNFINDESNDDIIRCQLTHELLHTLSQFKNNQQNWFGYQNEMLMGIDEATTQMFTEDIEGVKLTEEQDYLYFIKNIMRTMKVVVGEQKLASQYLNNDNSFESEINRLTNGNFASFANSINVIYRLSKKEKYSQINEQEKKSLDEYKKEIINKVSKMIIIRNKENVTLMDELESEFEDSNFLSNYFDILPSSPATLKKALKFEVDSNTYNEIMEKHNSIKPTINEPDFLK